MTTFNLSRHHRFNETDAAAHPAIIFSDRKSYLAWVSGWKADWHETVAAIRASKRIRGDKSRNDDERFAAQGERQSLRVVAFNMLALRKAARDASRLARAARQAA